MLTTDAMRKVELLIMKDDADAVVEHLGKGGFFQVDEPGTPETTASKGDFADHPVGRRLLEAVRYLGITPDTRILADTKFLSAEDEKEAIGIAERTEELAEREKRARERFERLGDALHEARAFGGLDVPFEEIDRLTYMSFRLGRLEVDKIGEVSRALGPRAVVVPLDDEGHVIAASSRKGRFALDSELKKAEFERLEIPKDSTGMPPEVVRKLESARDEARLALDGTVGEREAAAAELAPRIGGLLRSFSLASQVDAVKAGLESTPSVYRLSGWVPARQVKRVFAGLDALTAGRIAARVYLPKELDSVAAGKEVVPTALHHGPVVTAFQSLVFSYGAPLYGNIDPTFFVSIFFVTLFAIMFGDVGQGFVGVLIGIALRKNLIGKGKDWKKFSPIFLVVGCASMITGFLYGSFFANEEVLIPAVRWVTGTFFGNPVDRIITVMPTNGVGKLMVFFGFTVAVGVVINSVGLFINLYNQFRQKNYHEAIFSKTGVCGAFFFFYMLSIAIRVILGSMPTSTDMILIVVPLVLLFFSEPIHRLAAKESPVLENGAFAFVVQGLVEIIESVSYFISNTVSFLRVGAFALSHAVLSLICFTLADVMRDKIPGGVVLQVFTIVVFNLIIILLEGLIVAIQVVRLHYYEFFSKFFTESGEAFKPLRFVGKELS
jgi:V/A-type H+/Na+-transporting ATPase subunit I